jgi:hypothetical protein
MGSIDVIGKKKFKQVKFWVWVDFDWIQLDIDDKKVNK